MTELRWLLNREELKDILNEMFVTDEIDDDPYVLADEFIGTMHHLYPDEERFMS